MASRLHRAGCRVPPGRAFERDRLDRRGGAGDGRPGIARRRPLERRRTGAATRQGLLVSHALWRDRAKRASLSGSGDPGRGLAQRAIHPRFRQHVPRARGRGRSRRRQRTRHRLSLARRGTGAPQGQGALADGAGRQQRPAPCAHDPAGPHDRLAAAGSCRGPLAAGRNPGGGPATASEGSLAPRDSRRNRRSAGRRARSRCP